MSFRGLLGLLAVSTGCSAVFGLEDPMRIPDGGSVVDSSDGPVVDGAAGALVRRIDVTDVVSGGPHTNFPMLFRTTATWLRSRANGGDATSDLGADIWFSIDQDGSSVLAFEVEEFDAVNGALVAWIKVPSLTKVSAMYLHYGDTAPSMSRQNPVAVWTDYALVIHMGGSPVDVTTNNVLSVSALAGSTGTIGTATTYNGGTSAITTGPAASVNNVFAGGGLVEAWIRPTTFGEGTEGRIIEKDSNGGWQLHVDDVRANDSVRFTYDTTAAASDGEWIAAGTVTLGQWHHVALTMNSDNVTNVPVMYINGAAVTTTQGGATSGSYLSDASSTAYVGSNEVSDHTFAGQIDEVRLSTTTRSAQWIATEYANQSAPETFYTISAPL